MNEEILRFFKNPYYQDFLKKVRDKYCSLGKVGGSVQITAQSKKEAEELSLLLSLNIEVGKKKTVTLAHFKACLEDSKFEKLEIEDLLLLLYPKMMTKKESIEVLKNKKNEFLSKLIVRYQNTIIAVWLDKVLHEQGEPFKKLVRNLENISLYYVLDALISLPVHQNTLETLSVFSSKITKNPHYFDMGNPNNRLLLFFLASFLNCDVPETHQDKITLLDMAGITMDEVSNFVITYGFLGNPGLEYFERHYMPLNLNLNNIRSIDKITAKNNRIVIVENPSFLNKVDIERIDFSIIVTSGNANLALYKLLDKLKDYDLYYQGDFDPEGLLIAEKLKERYHNLQFIGYTRENYQKIKSSKKILESRLKKLEHVNSSELLEIKSVLLEEKYAAYQEENYDDLLKKLNERKKR